MVAVAIDMKPEMLKANPAVADDTGRVVLQRGPLVYCMEHADQKDDKKTGDLSHYAVRLTGETTTQYEAELLDAVMGLQHPGTITRPAPKPALYEAAVPSRDEVTTTTLRLIPYYPCPTRHPPAIQPSV